MPDYLRDWLRGITEAGERKGAVGVLVWKEPGARIDDAVVVLRLRDWQDLHGRAGAQGDRVIGSRLAAKTNAPDSPGRGVQTAVGCWNHPNHEKKKRPPEYSTRPHSATAAAIRAE